MKKEKKKKFVEIKEYETRRPHTRPINKLRLSVRLRLNPTVKDPIINIDGETHEKEERT